MNDLALHALTALVITLHKREVIDIADFIGEIRDAASAAPAEASQHLAAYAAALTRTLARQGS